MVVERCRVCGEYDATSRHKCKPRWLVQIDEHHDMDGLTDGITAYAVDAEDAAREGVEAWDDDRSALDNKYLVRVTAIDQEPGCAPEWFSITAEASVDYYANKANPPEPHA